MKKTHISVVLNDLGLSELQDILPLLIDGRYFNCLEVRPEPHYLYLVVDISHIVTGLPSPMEIAIPHHYVRYQVRSLAETPMGFDNPMETLKQIGEK